MPTPSIDIRKALIKLLAAAVVLSGLTFTCFHIDRAFVGVIGGIIILLAFPATILFSIDASRVIKREIPTNKSVRILGVVLGIPQAVLGVILIASGAVYPFFGLREMISDLSQGVFAGVPFIRTVTAIFMLGVGYYYLREGLGLRKGSGKRR